MQIRAHALSKAAAGEMFSAARHAARYCTSPPTANSVVDGRGQGTEAHQLASDLLVGYAADRADEDRGLIATFESRTAVLAQERDEVSRRKSRDTPPPSPAGTGLPNTTAATDSTTAAATRGVRPASKRHPEVDEHHAQRP